ncbi:MAG: hypothetical protein OHK006_24520 [Thermodesulfovibrionales bacterium]
MLVGYNTNISYKGTVYHVQTEDSGLKNPMIITLLYVKGTILSSKKTCYAHLADKPDYKDTVRELMKEQHKAMIKELIAGKHTPLETAAAPAQPPAEALPEGAIPAQEAAPAAQPPLPDAPVEEKPAQPAAEKKAHAPPPPSEEDDSKGQISRSLDDILLDYIIKGGQ